MAYTIIKSDGTILTTIPDGTINTTSTSIGLPGRNYAGYGQTLDTNFVHQLENFAGSNPPANPLRGQLWYNTNNSTLYVCPTDGETRASAWSALTSTASGGTTTFGSVVVQANLQANIVFANSSVQSNSVIASFLTISANASISSADISSATVGTLTSQTITTGGNTTAGTLTGAWNVDGNLTISGGNISGNTNGFTIGYLNVPQVAIGNVTLTLSDAGKHYYSTVTGNRTLTIPNNSTVAFSTGTKIEIVVQAVGNVLVNAASGVTLFMAGNSTSANRVVGSFGTASLIKVATDTWFISGVSVT